MALKAGYKGIKKSVLETLMSLVGSVVIKSVGDGLTLSEAGELSADINDVGDGLALAEGEVSVDIDTNTMEFTEAGKLAAKVSTPGVEVKTMTYTGDGTSTSSIDFSNEDALPTVILGICGESANNYYAAATPILYGVQLRAYCYWCQHSGSGKSGSQNIVSYTNNNTVMHIAGANSGEALNDNEKTYTVYYI